MTEKDFKTIFEDLVKKKGERSTIWNNWLEYCIDINLLTNSTEKIDINKINYKGNEKEYFDLFTAWIKDLDNKLKSNKVYDSLGLFYEELVKSHFKSKDLGQFFTPMDVTKLMAELTIPETPVEDGFVNDPCCGSGRMLMCGYVESKGKLRAIGQDMDLTSCMMTVLNFWSHGIVGSVIWMDTISNETYGAWRVNKYLNYGIPVPHIEKINPNEAYDFIGVNMKENKIEKIEEVPVKSLKANKEVKPYKPKFVDGTGQTTLF